MITDCGFAGTNRPIELGAPLDDVGMASNWVAETSGTEGWELMDGFCIQTDI